MITITDKASNKILSVAKEKEWNPVVRIGVRGGGCTGFAMFVEWGVFLKGQDEQFEKDGATVVVDKKSLVLLSGSTLDYVTSFKESGFKINAPNVKGSCGCGESVEF